VSVSTPGTVLLSALPASWRRLLIGGASILAALLLTPSGAPLAQETTEQCIEHSKEAAAEAKKALAASKSKAPARGTVASAPSPRGASKVATPAPKAASAAARRPVKRTLMTLRGELVDYYCYIEKGARGPEHRDCAMRCVAGDICMGLLTPDQKLMMLSVQHLRVMEPLARRARSLHDLPRTPRGDGGSHRIRPGAARAEDHRSDQRQARAEDLAVSCPPESYRRPIRRISSR
jgi:hypothetical protein